MQIFVKINRGAKNTSQLKIFTLHPLSRPQSPVFTLISTLITRFRSYQTPKHPIFVLLAVKTPVNNHFFPNLNIQYRKLSVTLKHIKS